MGEENYALNTSSFIPEYYSRIKDVAEFYGRSLNSQSVLFKKQGLVPIKLGSESFFYLKERIGRDYSHYMPFKYFKNTYGFDPEYCDFAEIEEQSRIAAIEICDASGIKPGQIFVVGCSSSEVLGARIGTATNTEVAEAIYNGISAVLSVRGVCLAGQCCEHLNRALVVEEEILEKYRFDFVEICH